MRPSAELLLAAADALDNHSDPLDGWFLREHEVTLDQAASMAEQLALGARIVAHAIEHPRSQQGRAMFEVLAETAMH